MTTEREQIRETIIEQYGAKASAAAGAPDALPIVQGEGGACCGPDCCSPTATDQETSLIMALYAQDQVAGLPDGALDAAAGCGNPTAIAEMKPGEVVLDLGSGGGIDCFLAAKQVGPQGRVIGVDMTRDMVDLARQNAVEIGATNVEFKLGEIEQLPVEDGSVDVVISNCVINLSTDKQRVLEEAYRALRPGGRFRISDIVWLKERPAGAPDFEEWAGCISGALALGDFLDRLTRAGFAGARAASVAPLDTERGLASALILGEKPL
jgi:arsenite methyltransferase